MTKISDKLKELQAKDQGFISLEFFPPKTDLGFKNLIPRIQRLSILNPLFINITWGAGGSTSERSLDLATFCQNELGLTVCLHLTCTNMNKEIIDDALFKAKEAGICNILALRGDPPRQEIVNDKIEENQNGFRYAIDLVKYIKQTHGDFFCIGVAAYPDGHVEGSDNSNQDFKEDIPFLIEKVKAGADFIITQLFFDVKKYLEFEELVYSHLPYIPVIPGLIPINNFQLFQRVSRLSHASIPKHILNQFPPFVQNDDKKVKDIGIKVLNDIINEIVFNNRGRVKGFHFYCLNLEASIARLVSINEHLQDYTNFSANQSANLSTTNSAVAATALTENHDLAISNDYNNKRKTISSTAPNKSAKFSRKEILEISSGIGTLGKEATWDEYPNGRFGDSRSPAYGEIDGYGPSLKIPIGYQNALSDSLWGAPQNLDDIAQLFIDFLSNKIPSLPFSDLEISAETLLIQEELFQINKKHRFSLSSQPAINSCNSNDSIFGWGSRNGHVFQKAFIEILISKQDWEQNLKPLIEEHNLLDSENDQDISYYVGAADLDTLETNIPECNRSTAVTWGVFPNKEIIQSTIIEEQSFRAWKDDAFKILNEWAKLYLIEWKANVCNSGLREKYKNSYELIKSIHDNFYVITLFSNNYQEGDTLWNLL